MKRVLVVGMGVPALVASRRHTGPGLRSAHLATAIAARGHEVLLVAVLTAKEAAALGEERRAGEAAPPPGAGSPSRTRAGASAVPGVELVTEDELLAPAMRRRLEAFAPDAVVGVTVYAAALACRLRLGVPLWADVFGDILAEAQAKAACTGSDWSLVHFWTLLRGVLEGADRFSAVSVAQSHALVGELGMAGRLSARTAGEPLVATIPCAAAVPAACCDRDLARRELGLDDAAFVLLVSGSVNTWCDVETLAAGVAAASPALPRLRVLVTGGSIPGHDESSHARLMEALGAGGARVLDLGWQDSSRLPLVYAASDLALHVERPLYERTLGAENRVVEWLAHGLPCVTTGLSETGRELVRDGLAFGCRTGDAEDLARAILEAASSPRLVREAGRRGRDWVAAHRDPLATAAALADWCDEPRAARDRDGARLVRVGLLTRPETSVEMLEAYVAALPAREVARRGLRWLARRAWAASRVPALAARACSAAGLVVARFRASQRRW